MFFHPFVCPIHLIRLFHVSLFFVRIARLIRVYDTPPSLSLILYFYSFLDRVTLGSVYH